MQDEKSGFVSNINYPPIENERYVTAGSVVVGIYNAVAETPSDQASTGTGTGTNRTGRWCLSLNE